MTARWPAMMRRKTVAEYCDLSEPAFEREVTAGRMPAPIMFGGREHWRKDAVDAAIARLAGEGDLPDHRRRLRERYGKKAA